MAPTQSRLLSSDSLIYSLSQSIDAVAYYGRLGVALLGNQAEVAGVLGKPIPHFEDAMFQCLIAWRNAQGRGCEESLIQIFDELGLKDALALLKEVRQQDGNQNCLNEDRFLYDLVKKIDCLSYYTALGTRLLNNSAKAQYYIGPVTPSYAEALYKCMIKWRNANGASTEELIRLREILMENELVDQAEELDKLENGGQDEIDLPDIPSSANGTSHQEPEACLFPDNRLAEQSTDPNPGSELE